MGNLIEAMTAAIGHEAAGRLPEAEQIFRQILAVEPNCLEVWHGWGVVAEIEAALGGARGRCLI